MAELRSRTLTRQTGAVAGRYSEPWQARAACASPDVDGELFFIPSEERPGADRRDRIETAKSICRTCPVRAECLAYAQTTRQNAGIWGGLDEDERAELRRQRPGGLP
ncbi:WhiB family transcriptional regulator [Cellulomonas sp. A375-1]|uniref:WhiB family transcriptional regulator n=1 Tax=Cellulomonas sp. A375-1 TaxID=1672219 RepID=UPI0009E2D01F|nr:WhiB family transcriptional regulator [Cellulomonas sp. A375-1]